MMAITMAAMLRLLRYRVDLPSLDSKLNHCGGWLVSVAEVDG